MFDLIDEMCRWLFVYFELIFVDCDLMCVLIGVCEVDLGDNVIDICGCVM